ncbi:PREDICTED: beta-defensin 106A-like [Miniopterus natalensis]|uniref:beta-defensin 106A-like n=1 Tax=Miniopterus natalensis TaxID=291302 RepID=UPI0007A6E87D|nr:PREDICTED: beta-defensin 106A-like [Miniopterus natalensis]
MRPFLFLLAAFFFLGPARNEFFDEKCIKLKGKCVSSCQKTEELVALCRKALKCCLVVQPCLNS